MSGTLQGKKILVTQANSFMGPVLCQVLAEHGANVVASELSLVEERAAETVIAASGDLDALLANLALPAPSTLAIEVTNDE
jgi:2-keto-3-deoxy-L-fuconate dehydrogenase